MQLLKNIAIVGSGQNAPQKENHYLNGEYTFIKVSNLDDIIYDDNEERASKINDLAISECKLKPYNKNSIIFAKSGLSCVKNRVYLTKERTYIVNHLCVLSNIKETIDSEWLTYFIKNYNVTKLIKDESYPSISLKDIGNIVVPEISIEEQKSIVKNLNEISKTLKEKQKAFNLCNELIKSRFIEMFGDLENNTHNYPIKSLSEISTYWNGLTYKPTDVVGNNDGILVLRSSNIQEGQLAFEDNVYVNCNIKERQYVKENDILMCSRNGSARLVGKVALIKGLDKPTSFGAFMMIFRSEYYPYLKVYFEMPDFRSQLATGTSTINQITGGMLNAVKLPVPDLDTVMKFKEFVEQIDKLKFVNYSRYFL